MDQETATPAIPAPTPAKWTRHLDEVALTVSAQWPTLKMSARSIISLKPGDMLDLQPEASEKVELRVGKVVKFKGRLGTRDGKWAIQINSICKV
jgi:flagellar motor switch protein FliM